MFRHILHRWVLLWRRLARLVERLDIRHRIVLWTISVFNFRTMTRISLQSCLQGKRASWVPGPRSERRHSLVGLKDGNNRVGDGIWLPRLMNHLWTCFLCGATKKLRTWADFPRWWQYYGQIGLLRREILLIFRVVRPTWEKSSLLITISTWPRTLTSKFGSVKLKKSDIGCLLGGITSKCLMYHWRVVLKCLCWFAARSHVMTRRGYYIRRLH